VIKDGSSEYRDEASYSSCRPAGRDGHLRAFMKGLVQQGGSYLPQHIISQAEFAAIVNSPVENGP
jgi:hypothetical protein